MEVLLFGNTGSEDESAAGQVTSVLHSALMWDLHQVSLKASVSERVLNKTIGNALCVFRLIPSFFTSVRSTGTQVLT